MTQLIAITGPESCGKTELSEALAALWPGSLVVGEYAREYLGQFHPGYRYTERDVLAIAQEQHRRITHARLSHRGMIFCDSDFLVLHIWLSEVFAMRHSVAADWFRSVKFDAILLCKPDIPWEPDPLRENPNDRDRLFALYESELKAANKIYDVVEGLGNQRIACAAERLISRLQFTS